MRIIAALALGLMLATPLSAAETCQWQSADGAQIWTQPGEFSVVEKGFDADHCMLRGNGPGNAIMTAVCGAHDWAFFTVKSEPGSDDDILIFRNTAWYKGC